MARPPYSELAISTTVTAAVEFTFIIPDGIVWITRDISAAVTVPPGEGFSLTIASNGVEFATWQFPAVWRGMVHRECRVVVPGPSTVVASATGSGGSAELSLSGYWLT